MAQIQKKFIAADAVDGSKLRLSNNQYLRARNAADSGDVNIVKANASDKIEFASVPQVSADASAGNDLVRYSQVQSLLEGLKPKEAVRVASIGSDVVIASELENGDVLDTITLATGDRVLLKDQTDPKENGIYIVSASGAASRASDMNASSEFPGSYTVQTSGSASNQGKAFVCTVASSFALGTDNVTFVLFKSTAIVSGHDMIALSGTELSVDLAAVSGLESSSPGNAGGQLRIKLEASSPSLKFTGSNELAAKLDAAGAIASGASGLAVQVDGSTIEISSNALRVKAAGITESHLNTSVAGDMIAGGAGSPLSVDLAAVSGLESSSAGNAAGQLRVKLEASNPSLKIDGSNQLAAKLDAAGAIASGASGLAVQVASGIEISSNALRISSAAAGTGLDWSAGVLSQSADFAASASAPAASAGLRAKESGSADKFAVGYADSSTMADAGSANSLAMINQMLGEITYISTKHNTAADAALTGDFNAFSGSQDSAGGSGASGAIFISSGTVAGSGSSGVASFRSGGTATAASGQVRIRSGDVAGGTANSGRIYLQSGTSAGGTRGVIKLDGSSIDASSTQIQNVSDPTAAQHAATKAYVDGLSYLTAGSGLAYSPAGTLNVGAADTSIQVNANDIQVNLAASSGLEVSSGLKVKLEASDPSLKIASGELGIKMGAGIEKGGDGIYVDAVRHAEITLAGGDITNQYYDLSAKFVAESFDFEVSGLSQRYGVDYDLDNSGSVSRLRWDSTNFPSSDLATGGAAALVAGDKLYCKGIRV